MPNLRLDDWNTLACANVRAEFRRAWTPPRPLGVGDLAPYLRVLGDPSVPRVARWIAADALVPALTGMIGEALVAWLHALPVDQREAALAPLLAAATRQIRAARATGADDAPVSGFWIGVALAVVDDLPGSGCEALSLLLCTVHPWPPEIRTDARALAARLADRIDVPDRTMDVGPDGGMNVPRSGLRLLFLPWAEGLAGADAHELAEFEARVTQSPNGIFVQSVALLPRIHAIVPECALRLWGEIARRLAHGAAADFQRTALKDLFRFLLSHDGPRALDLLLAAYADAIGPAQPPPWIPDPELSTDLVKMFGADEPAGEAPLGPGRSFRVVDHQHFAIHWIAGSDPLRFKEGTSACPFVLVEVAAEWVAQGRTQVLRDAFRVLLRRNILRGFWEAGLHLLARFPAVLAVDGVPLFKDPEFISGIGLWHAGLAATRACVRHLSDRTRDAIERTLLAIDPTRCFNAPLLQSWYARAMADAGVTDRPRTPKLRALLEHPPSNPLIETPVALQPGAVLPWSGQVLGPSLDGVSSRYGAPLAALWRAAEGQGGKPPTPAAAREAWALFLDVAPYIRAQAEGPVRSALWKALEWILSAPKGALDASEVTRQSLKLGPWQLTASTDNELLPRAAILAHGLRHCAPTPWPEGQAALRALLDHPATAIRTRGAQCLASVGWISTDGWPELWNQAFAGLAQEGGGDGLAALLGALAHQQDPLPAAASGLLAQALRDVELWHHPVSDHLGHGEGILMSPNHLDPERWQGDEAAVQAGALLARTALEADAVANRRLPELLKQAAEGDRLALMLSYGVAVSIAKVHQEAAGTPERMARLRAFLRRQCGSAGGIRVFAESWISLAHGPADSPVANLRKRMLLDAALAVVDAQPPVGESGADAGALAGVEELLGAPDAAERAWEMWLR